MTINLSDIPAAVTDYLNTKVTTVISDGTPDSGTLNPGEEATFKITVTNAGAPDGVRLTNVVYHLRIEPTAFGVLKVNPSAAIVTRASLDPAGPLLPRNTFVAEMFVFQIDNTLEVGESHELISEVKGVIEGRAVVTVDVHADIPIESLLPTGENTTPTEQAFRTR